ncbi:uncharacterized protein LOC103524675 isoform X1 [Diaphorina citri]|uniref:Uncharacterized protein LOC103524675 isoform X1 n=1 Tax=Diaphorina citri TaxID=121845 RepID=A0A1S3DVS6_DIACI|nr:uncharacterized protein LOC103524675 isoform X1 [Diaphorina citri]
MGSEFKNTMDEYFKSESFKKIIEDAVQNAVEKKFKEMEEKVKHLEEENEKLTNQIDDLEQYGRRNNIKIYGIQKVDPKNLEKEVVKEINEKAGASIVSSQIEACHYLDKNKTSVIVRFVSRKTRDDVYYLKKNLKGTRISITEDLTKKKYQLLKECQKHFEKRSLWTKYGVVKLHLNGKVHNIKNMKALEDLKKMKRNTQ